MPGGSDINQLIIHNNGGEITDTNFWQTAYNTRGLFFVSVNAGTFRVLVPDQHVNAHVPEMQTARFVSVERDRERVVIVFDDLSDAPYRLDLDVRQFDRLPSAADSGRNDLRCSVWTRGVDERPRKVFECPARYEVH